MRICSSRWRARERFRRAAPPDFHAVAELWLDGAWRLVDATGMATADTIARVCAGRDATDIAFMTVFGTAQFVAQTVRVTQA